MEFNEEKEKGQFLFVFLGDENRNYEARKNLENGINDVNIFGYGSGENFASDNVKRLKSAADTGCASSQHYLSLMYAWGEGVEKDLNEAFKWCKKAAEQNNYAAHRDLGFMYIRGEGCLSDTASGMRHLKIAGKNGDVEAQVILGHRFMNNDDMDAAKYWLRLAAKGDPQSGDLLREILLEEENEKKEKEAKNENRES